MDPSSLSKNQSTTLPTAAESVKDEGVKSPGGSISHSLHWLLKEKQIKDSDLTAAMSDFITSAKLSGLVKSAMRRAIARTSGKETAVLPVGEDSPPNLTSITAIKTRA